MKTIKKIVTFIAIFIIIFVQTIPIYAEEQPIISVPNAPTAPSQPTAPTPPSAPKESDENKPDDHNQSIAAPENNQDSLASDGNVADTNIQTGNSTLGASILTTANDNVLVAENPSQEATSTNVANDNNGSNSTNNGSIENINNTNTTQNNNAAVGNDLILDNVTGQNVASQNVGNSFIQTGDANTSGTVVTNVNSNAGAVMVSEFNIADNQNGDIILDFAKNCISGCGGSAVVQNSNNGAFSENTGSITDITNNNTFQNNDAEVGSTLTLNSDSGNNQADKNTGGDSIIKTGDANTSGSILTLANNNIAGEVIYGVVNIFGDLIGDIILPESALTTSAVSSGNGDFSESEIDINQVTNNNTLQTNISDIQNNLNLEAATGDNSASQNTGGDTVVKTGDASILSQTLNIVNSNIDGSMMWLVIINEAGQWLGKILGAPEGTNLAGSGLDFQIAEDGTITATNSDNDLDSQNNNAYITNNLNLSANTGQNSTSQNTGGDNFIQTGDAKIIANLVNFVNNNIASSGRLAVVTINVFGSWLGDFVAPGTQKVQQTSVNQTGGGVIDENTSQNSQINYPSNEVVVEEINISESKDLVTDFKTSKLYENLIQVKGFKTEANSLQNSINIENIMNKKPVKLNLAWGLLILPFIIITIFLKLIRYRH